METLIASALTGAGATAGISGGAAMAAGVMPVAGSAGLSAATAGSIASGITQGFSLLSAIGGGMQQKYAYDAQAEGYKAQAYQEKLKAQEDANVRRSRLLKALSAQSAYGGAAGVRGGTPEALKLESISEYEDEQQGADLMSSLTQSNLSRKASTTKTMGKQALTGSLLNYGTKLARIG